MKEGRDKNVLCYYCCYVSKGSFLSESLKRLKKYSKSLSWAENLNFPPIKVNNLFKCQAQDSDLKYFFEPLQTFWQKATFSCVWFCFISTYIDYLKLIKIYFTDLKLICIYRATLTLPMHYNQIILWGIFLFLLLTCKVS